MSYLWGGKHRKRKVHYVNRWAETRRQLPGVVVSLSAIISSAGDQLHAFHFLSRLWAIDGFWSSYTHWTDSRHPQCLTTSLIKVRLTGPDQYHYFTEPSFYCRLAAQWALPTFQTIENLSGRNSVINYFCFSFLRWKYLPSHLVHMVLHFSIHSSFYHKVCIWWHFPLL